MTAINALKHHAISSVCRLSPAYRGKQVFAWIHARGARSFDAMTNLPAEMRRQLAAEFTVVSSSVSGVFTDPDGTVKLRIRLSDGGIIETVLLTDENGIRTACLSSQLGCGMGCEFCSTARMGLRRNLADHEIVEQFLHLQDTCGEITHIVFMGMGEPLANYDAVLTAVEIFHDPEGSGIGYRRITLSTCGVADGIVRLAQTGPPVRLAVSLVSADPSKRSRLMPVTARFDLETLRASLTAYLRLTGKRITLEYVLLRGENDGIGDIEALEAFVRDLDVVVNVIPLNPGDGIGFSAPQETEIRRFMTACEERRIPVTRRYRRGRGVNGACGQLAVDSFDT